MNQALLIFARNLIYGHVKTRIAATLGNDTALYVYKKLLQHTCTIANTVAVDKIVFYSNYIEKDDDWGDNSHDKQIQQGNDLGTRMEHAFMYAFEKGYEQAAIIGTDCPELSSEIINEAFTRLKEYDLIIGPARDGGYYLLAMRSLYKPLFKNISWSTHMVLDETLAIAKELKLSYSLLPVLNDIDDEKDLALLKEFQYDKHNHSNI